MSRDLNSDEMGGTFDQPPQENRERAEAEWLLARDSDPSAPPPSEAAGREYEELEHLLGTLPEPAVDQSWHDEVLRKAQAGDIHSLKVKQRPARHHPAGNHTWWKGTTLRWATGGVAMAAAIIIFVVVSRKPPRDENERIALANTLRAEEVTEYGVRDDEGQVIGFDIDSPDGDLRIFRKGIDDVTELEMRCPGDKGCTKQGSRFVFRFDCGGKRVDYYVVVGIDGGVIPLTHSARQFAAAVEAHGGASELLNKSCK